MAMSASIAALRPILDASYADATCLQQENGAMFGQAQMQRSALALLLDRNRRLQEVVDRMEKDNVAVRAEVQRLEGLRTATETEFKSNFDKHAELKRRISQCMDEEAALNTACVALSAKAQDAKSGLLQDSSSLATRQASKKHLEEQIRSAQAEIQDLHVQTARASMACEQAARDEGENARSLHVLHTRREGLACQLERVERERDEALTRLDTARASQQSSLAQERALREARGAAERETASVAAHARSTEEACARAQAAVVTAAAELDLAATAAREQRGKLDDTVARLHSLHEQRATVEADTRAARAEGAAHAQSAALARAQVQALTQQLQRATLALQAARGMVKASAAEAAALASRRAASAAQLAAAREEAAALLPRPSHAPHAPAVAPGGGEEEDEYEDMSIGAWRAKAHASGSAAGGSSGASGPAPGSARTGGGESSDVTSAPHRTADDGRDLGSTKLQAAAVSAAPGALAGGDGPPPAHHPNPTAQAPGRKRGSAGAKRQRSEDGRGPAGGSTEEVAARGAKKAAVGGGGKRADTAVTPARQSRPPGASLAPRTTDKASARGVAAGPPHLPGAPPPSSTPASSAPSSPGSLHVPGLAVTGRRAHPPPASRPRGPKPRGGKAQAQAVGKVPAPPLATRAAAAAPLVRSGRAGGGSAGSEQHRFPPPSAPASLVRTMDEDWMFADL